MCGLFGFLRYGKSIKNLYGLLYGFFLKNPKSITNRGSTKFIYCSDAGLFSTSADLNTLPIDTTFSFTTIAGMLITQTNPETH